MDDGLAVALGWLLSDRELSDGGGTPARRYAELPALSGSERDLARRISASWLGLHG